MQKTASQPDRLMTVREAADWLQISESGCYKLAKSGQIPSVRVGKGSVRFVRADLAKWIAMTAGPREVA